MGFSIPAALASCIARPKQRTIALIGDAGFLMRATELEIATRLKLHPIIVIFTDRTLGMIRVKQSSKNYGHIKNASNRGSKFFHGRTRCIIWWMGCGSA